MSNWNQGYIPQNRETSVKKPIPIKPILAAVIVMVIIAAIGVVVAVNGNQAKIDANTIIQKFISAGLPIENIVAYNEQSDPNKLLGRPKSYTEKMSFADSRIKQYTSDPKGGSVEIFNSASEATNRNIYISAFSGTIFGSYVFQKENVIVMISYKLTPEQAEAYNTVLGSK